MRYIRYGFWAVVGIALIAVAIANRDIVTLNVLPQALEDLTGISHNVSLPLFIVILMSVAFGVMIGFVWEWLREHKHRAEKSRTQKELKHTKREVRRLKGRDSEHKDEVLALLE